MYLYQLKFQIYPPKRLFCGSLETCSQISFIKTESINSALTFGCCRTVGAFPGQGHIACCTVKQRSRCCRMRDQATCWTLR